VKNYFNLFERNRSWAQAMRDADPEYFAKRSQQQEPHFLFIGCCDSRVPAESLTGALPGEMFTHRNIANQVHPNDINVMSTLEYAVEALDVKHVIVCGHYGCGGVRAAMGGATLKLTDHWLYNVRELQRLYGDELHAIRDARAREDRLVELNVIASVRHLARSPVIQECWAKGDRPILHGLVYDLNDGILRPVVTGLVGNEATKRLRDHPPGPVDRSPNPPLPDAEHTHTWTPGIA
jgi:carbonic anhydrase